MEKLQDLSQSELEELLENTERVESMALESDEIQNVQLEREMSLASNRSLAEQNLEMKPRLQEQRLRLVERYSQLETARDAYTQHCQLRDGIAGQVAPEVLFSRLQTEGTRTEAQSEALADEFLEGSLPLDMFLDNFLSLRSLAHKRRVAIDKLQDLLRQRAPPSAVTSSKGTGQDRPATTAPSSTNHHPQQPQSSNLPANHASQSTSSTLPYSPYPGPAPSAAMPQPPYPGSAYCGPRPAFGTPGSVTCPYPTHQAFPGPHPGSAFAPPPQPYPASYNYGGYSYPAPPANQQSPAGRPAYRAGYGVPQPFS